MIGNMIASMIAYVLLLVLFLYVVRAWLRWFRSDPRLGEPQWRSRIATLGFGASTASLLIILAVAIHAVITGGLPYYHPVLMLAFRLGFLTTVLGIAAGMVGTGQLETPNLVCSVSCLLIWFVEAMAQ
jgi:cytochrome b561